MRIYAFYHGRIGGERLAWIDRQPGSLWIVINGYAVAICWGNWPWKLDPYGPDKATGGWQVVPRPIGKFDMEMKALIDALEG